eukprot:NODE_186_length_13589_cov_0.385545.p15 type:complete len:100 gc:universal NODE_186_length_13589_cov_0.385545:12286-11987(-)
MIISLQRDSLANIPKLLHSLLLLLISFLHNQSHSFLLCLLHTNLLHFPPVISLMINYTFQQHIIMHLHHFCPLHSSQFPYRSNISILQSFYPGKDLGSI